MALHQANNMFQDLKNIYHLFQAIIANLWYGFPSKDIKVIGITGTDGKTTTTHLIAHILKSAGNKTSFISSIYASIAGKEYDIGFHVTTPSPFAIQKYLRRAADNGDEYFVLETTSHALDQNRVWGVRYEIGAITNISHEHLDYHKTFEEYEMTKFKLLKMSKLKFRPSNKLVKLIENIPDLTNYNKQNYSVAFKVAKSLGISEKQIVKSMKTFKLPKGRLEVVHDRGFMVIIDFAHTPNAFANLLPEVKKMIKNKGRLIHVFGAAGLRDDTKRPLMGKISSEYSDYIILTEEDYRTEKLSDICKEIAKGIKNKPFRIIENREDAIRKGIQLAKNGDVLLLTGKSHEKSLCRGKIEYPWNEYKAVKKALNT